MRLLLVFLLGIGVVTQAACKSHDTSEVKADKVTLDVTGMT
jgi:hypothetical protein